MPYKIPNTFNAQTPVGQSVQNLMGAYFGNLATPDDVAKAGYLQAQTESARTKAALDQQKLGASTTAGNLVAKILSGEPIETTAEAPRMDADMQGPMPGVTTSHVPTVDERMQGNLGPLVTALIQSEQLGQLGNLNRAVVPWAAGGTQRDTDKAMLGAGDAYSTTQSGFETAQANELKKADIAQTGQDRRTAATIDAANLRNERTIAAQNNRTQNNANLKQQQKDQVLLKGKQNFEAVLSKINDLYDKLQQGGDAVSQQNSAIKNVTNYMANTSSPDGFFSFLPSGQTVGRALGTPAQGIRDEIASLIPILSAELKNATGMSSQQLNSNFELQQYLKALTSPTTQYEANKNILRNLSSSFGIGKLAGGTHTPLPGAAPAAAPAAPAAPQKPLSEMTLEELQALRASMAGQ